MFDEIKLSRRSGILLGALALCAMFALGSAIPGAHLPKAEATYPDWSGFVEKGVSGSQATASPALICTASTNLRKSVKAGVLNGGTSGIYTFFSNSTPSGAHQVGQLYLVANTPFNLTPDACRNTFRTANGEGLYCVGAGTLTYQLSVWDDPSN